MITVLAMLASQILAQQDNQQQGFTYQAVARNSNGTPMADQLLSVRLAIQENGPEGEIVWQEEHKVQTSSLGLFTLIVGDPEAIPIDGTVDSFDQIDWSSGPYYLGVQIDADGEYLDMGGSPITRVPLAQFANTASSATSFSVQPAAETQPGEPLFQVKRKDGQPVFAVYEDMVWVYVDTLSSKGKKGGFAVGGYSTASKGVTQEYMRVTPDSVRVYVSEDAAKGKKGGFAVGGYSTATKGNGQEYLRVTPDSVRVYIDTDSQVKGKKGGFAVGGYSAGSVKGNPGDLYFNLSPSEDAELVRDKSQILFYPAKDAFFAGTIHIGDPDSVGLNSTALGYKSVAMGRYSQAFGYKCLALGDYSTAIGKEAVSMENSFALGNTAVAVGNDSYAFGSAARASGEKSFAFGSVGIDTVGMPTDIPTTASGDYSIAFGMGARATSFGAMSMGAGSNAEGYKSVAIGPGATALGSYASAIGYLSVANGSYASSMGYMSEANGTKSIAIGSYYSYTYLEIIKGGGFKPIRVTRENSANGSYSVSLGNGNSSNDGGLALGTFNDAGAFGAAALGFSNNASGRYSLAAGYNNDALGYYSMAIGENVYSKAMNSLAVGTFNDTTVGTRDQWVETDPLFQIGNGTSNSNRHDAFRVDKNGRVQVLPVNSRYGMYLVTSADEENVNSTIYGFRSIISSSDPDLSGAYSGRFTGGITAGTYYGLYADTRTGDGFDVAEYIYDTRGDTEAGDVLVADPETEKSVLKSSVPYQVSVVGVVSTDPQLVMGMELVVDEETGEPLEGVKATRLALTGRVPVKITEENGPVRPGDLLTTSSTPGHAMKWSLLDMEKAKDFEELKSMLAENERRRHAVIGKALGSSGSGSGKVMVLISLQ